MGIGRSIVDNVERKQLAWHGYVQRMDENRLLKQIMKWILLEKRKTKNKMKDGNTEGDK